MLIPPGFCQQSVPTSLGQMVYYTSETTLGAAIADPQAFPALVFLHGFGGGSSAYEWSFVYPAFSLEYRILAADLVGWGRSDHPARSYRAEDYIDSIIEFLERSCNGPASVVASSLTAGFVIRAAIARPDLFKALFLTAPTGLSDFGEDYSRSFFAQLVKIPLLDQLIYRVGIANREGIRLFLEQRQFARAERVSPEMVEAYLESALQPNGEYAALSFVRGDLCFDLSTDMPLLQVPTAILWGDQAQFTSADLGERLAALNPQAVKTFHRLEDAGLTPHLEFPAIAIALIRRFLISVS